MVGILSRLQLHKTGSFALSTLVIEKLCPDWLVVFKEGHDVLLIDIEAHVGEVNDRSNLLRGVLHLVLMHILMFMRRIRIIKVVVVGGHPGLHWLGNSLRLSILRVTGASAFDGFRLVLVLEWLVEGVGVKAVVSSVDVPA